MKERDIIKQIVKYLESIGCTVFKHYGCVYSVKGHSDLYGFTSIESGCRPFFIEVKVPGRKPDAHQSSFLDRMSNAGAIAFYATSVDNCKSIFE